MLWTASGLPIDLLRVASLVVPGLMPPGVDWLGLATRALALAALVVLAHLALARPAAPASTRDVRSATRQLVRLRRARARAALPGPQDVVGAGRELRAQVAGSGRPGRLVRPVAARRPVAAGGRPVPAPGADAALAAAPAVAGRRLVRHRRRRHGRPGRLLVVGQRADRRRCRLRRLWPAGSSVSSTAAGSSGPLLPAPPPAPIRCVVAPCRSGWGSGDPPVAAGLDTLYRLPI